MEGETPLHLISRSENFGSTKCGKPKVVKNLLAFCAEWKFVYSGRSSDDGGSQIPLDVAIECKQIDVIKALTSS